MTDGGPLFRIVLVEPEIPQNTGNIGRTCVAARSELHLIDPLGFEISDKQLRRAGLDYWPHLTWHRHPNLASWSESVPDHDRVFYFSTKATKLYTEVSFRRGDWFVFGRETRGLDPELVRRNADRALRIPLLGPTRSLNLASSVAIVTFEGVRQLGESSHTV